MKFWNNYELDPNYKDRALVKEIEIDLKDRSLLFNIIKKRKTYKFWQPNRKDRSKIIRAMEDLDS